MDLNTNNKSIYTDLHLRVLQSNHRFIVYAVIYSTQNPNSAPCNDRQLKKSREKRASFPDDQFELSFFLCRCNRERCQRKAQKRATRGMGRIKSDYRIRAQKSSLLVAIRGRNESELASIRLVRKSRTNEKV